MSTLNQTLERLYTDESGAYLTAASLHREAKKTIKNLTLQQVRDFLATRGSAQRFASAARTGKWAHMHPTDYQWEVDIMFTGSPTGIFLVAVDKTSRYIYLEPVRGRTEGDIITAMENIFERERRVPETLYSDRESAWTGAAWGNLMKKHGIKHIFTSTHAPLVERTIGILKQKHSQLRAARREAGEPLPRDIRASYRKLVEGINKHQEMAREDDATREELRDGAVEGQIPNRSSRLKVGDSVRIRLKTTKHSVAGRWSTGTHTITRKISSSGITTYTVNNKNYLGKDLQKISKGTIPTQPARSSGSSSAAPRTTQPPTRRAPSARTTRGKAAARLDL